MQVCAHPLLHARLNCLTTEPAPCVRDSIPAALYAEDRETDTYIVDRLKGGVDIPKKCATEEQRQHYRLALSLVAPEPKEEGDQTGMAGKYST
jgi:hypothetical protein